MTKEQAKKTIQSAIITAMQNTALETGLTADRSDNLIRQIIKCVFYDPSIKWAVKELLLED